MTKYCTDEMLRSKVLYDDENIKIREKCITLKKYYFPICTSRRIPIDEITKVERVDVDFTGKMWGFSMARPIVCLKKKFKMQNTRQVKLKRSLKTRMNLIYKPTK